MRAIHRLRTISRYRTQLVRNAGLRSPCLRHLHICLPLRDVQKDYNGNQDDEKSEEESDHINSLTESGDSKELGNSIAHEALARDRSETGVREVLRRIGSLVVADETIPGTPPTRWRIYFVILGCVLFCIWYNWDYIVEHDYEKRVHGIDRMMAMEKFDEAMGEANKLLEEYEQTRPCPEVHFYLGTLLSLLLTFT